MQRPRVLLLLPTTSYRTQAFMDAAQRLGVEITVGSEEASTLANSNPTGLLTLDFADPTRAAEQAAGFAAKNPIAAVIGVDDQVAAIGAAISASLGLSTNTIEAAAAAKNKHRMHELLAAGGVFQPGFRLASIADDPQVLAVECRYPCVVKPLSLAASQGVIRANDEREFISAVTRLKAILNKEALRSSSPAHLDHYLIEDYIAGPEVAVEGLLTRGRFRVLAIFDKPDPLDGPFFEETIYVTPSRQSPATQAVIAAASERACRAIGLVHGPVHVECRLPGPQPEALGRQSLEVSNPSVANPCVIEVNPRSIGGLCSRALRFGVGISLEELIIRHAIDERYEPPAREARSAGVMMIPIPRAGRFREVRGVEAARRVPCVEQVVISAHTGQSLEPLPEGSLYLGFIFARGESPGAVEQALRQAHAALEIVIETGESR